MASDEGAEGAPTRPLILIVALLLALAFKAALYSAGAVPFNSDEAIVGLMASHIIEGQAPVFFYGQAYMGSLDAWLIAGFFRAFGPAVVWIRVVQAILYALFLVSAWLLARTFFPRRRLARWVVLLGALPPVLVTTYTSATLGGYGEILLLGNLCLILGYRVLSESGRKKEWVLLGLAAGLGFWTLGLIVVYVLPVAVIGLLRLRPSRAWLSGITLAAAGFLLGSAPWWLYNWSHNGAALMALTGGTPLPSSLGARLAGLFALGLPALLGLRFPWSPQFLPYPLLFLGLVLHLAVFLHLFERFRHRSSALGLGTRLLLVMVAGFAVIFAASQFGIDSTGRYLLPLYLPLLLASAYLLEAGWRWRRPAAYAALAGFLLLNGAATAQAAVSPAGITTQFDPITRFGNQHDEALIEFFGERSIETGYSNYWVAYRIGFLSGEDIMLSPELPYKADLRYTDRDVRIDEYKTRADAAEKLVYVTTLHPQLDQRLQQGFSELGVSFEEIDIGPYHVFFNLSRPVRPDQLGDYIAP